MKSQFSNNRSPQTIKIWETISKKYDKVTQFTGFSESEGHIQRPSVEWLQWWGRNQHRWLIWMMMSGWLGVIDKRSEREGTTGKPLLHHTNKITSSLWLPSPHMSFSFRDEPIHWFFFHSAFSLTSPIKQSQALMVISLTQSCLSPLTGMSGGPGKKLS